MSESSITTEALGDLAIVLGRLGCRWCVFGARAAAVWGHVRYTADLDVTVEIAEGSSRQLVDALEAGGFELRFADVDSFVERTRVIPMRHRETRLDLDLVLAGPGLEEQLLANARRVAFGSIEVPVIAPEDLVVTKILAARPKDLDDALAVVRLQRSGLDVGRIRRFLGLLEEALGQGDLLPAFERILDEVDGRP